jgi:hypothetical protein
MSLPAVSQHLKVLSGELVAASGGAGRSVY